MAWKLTAGRFCIFRALPIIAEARGKTEDAAFAASIFRLLHDGTRSGRGERFRRLHCPTTFVRKQQNIAGTQLADLCGYPASRHILKPAQQNLAFVVVRAHFYERDGETVARAPVEKEMGGSGNFRKPPIVREFPNLALYTRCTPFGAAQLCCARASHHATFHLPQTACASVVESGRMLKKPFFLVASAALLRSAKSKTLRKMDFPPGQNANRIGSV